MPIDPKDLYDQAFEAHRHTSYRAKIIGGWAAMYTAFAGVFVWVQANQEGSDLGSDTCCWRDDADDVARRHQEPPA